MEKNINLAKILNGKPVNTKLWSPLFGDVYTSSICSEDTIIVVNHHAESSSFYNNGKYFNHAEAELLLFPSKEIRDWSKFAWKKGDILVSEDNVHIIFEKFENDAYTKFRGKYYLYEECYNEEVFQMETSVFEKATDDDAQTYIKTIEEHLDGKLNLETLEIEKQQLFDALEKEGKAWDSNKKQVVDLKPKVELKPFDRCIWKIRNCEGSIWKASFVSYVDEYGATPMDMSIDEDLVNLIILPYNDQTKILNEMKV